MGNKITSNLTSIPAHIKTKLGTLLTLHIKKKSFVLLIYCILIFVLVFGFFKPVIMGELAGGGSVVVAVGVNDRWQFTGDTRHVTLDIRHAICDAWYATSFLPFFLFFFFTFNNLFKFRVMPGYSIIEWKIPCSLVWAPFNLKQI